MPASLRIFPELGYYRESGHLTKTHADALGYD